MIYVLEFERPLGNPDNPRAQARYYLGWCEDDRLEERFSEHLRGWGAAITRAAVNRRIAFEVVLKLPGDRTEERRLKNYKNTPKLVERYRRQLCTLES